MVIRFVVAVGIGLLVWPGYGLAQITHVDTFDVPPSGNWQFEETYNQSIQEDGGNPGAFLYTWMLDTYAAKVRTPLGAGGLFIGNYYERQVTNIGIDARTFWVEYPNVGNRPMTLMLYSDNGTPSNFEDDWAAYSRGPNIPFMEDGWLSYDYEIPYDAQTFPPGWEYFPAGDQSPLDPDWHMLMTNVVRVRFHWGDPEMFYIYQKWNLGIDNARITYIPEPSALGLLALGALGLLRRR